MGEIDQGVRSSAQVMVRATESAERSLDQAHQAGAALDVIERAVGSTAEHAALIAEQSSAVTEDATALGQIIPGTAAIATQTTAGIGGLNSHGAKLLAMSQECSDAVFAQTQSLQQVARTLQNLVGYLSQSVQIFNELSGMLRNLSAPERGTGLAWRPTRCFSLSRQASPLPPSGPGEGTPWCQAGICPAATPATAPRRPDSGPPGIC